MQAAVLHRDHFCSMRTLNSNVTECLQVAAYVISQTAMLYTAHQQGEKKKEKKKCEIMMEGPLDLLLQRPQLETFISFASLPFRTLSSEYNAVCQQIIQKESVQVIINHWKDRISISYLKMQFHENKKNQLGVIKTVNTLLLSIG